MKYRIVVYMNVRAEENFIPQYKSGWFWHSYEGSYDCSVTRDSLRSAKSFLIDKYKKDLKRNKFKKYIIPFDPSKTEEEPTIKSQTMIS